MQLLTVSLRDVSTLHNYLGEVRTSVEARTKFTSMLRDFACIQINFLNTH